MSRDVLTIAPYYGGKSRMAHYIADRLNYDDTDLFLTPFGGMCRVLLNKPRHKDECYNDYGEGVCALMSVLSNPDTAHDFIYRLYETEYSEAQFLNAKAIFDKAETDMLKQTGNLMERELKSVLVGYGLCPPGLRSDEFTKYLKQSMKSTDELALTKRIKMERPSKRDEINSKLKALVADYTDTKKAKEQGQLLRPRHMGALDVSDIDLAIATYIVFQQSRDAMGKVWTPSKFKDSAHYRRNMENLFECSERMQGVKIHQIDATNFFNWYAKKEEMDNISEEYQQMTHWLNNPKAMVLADPSYIKPDQEEKLLKGIDWKNEPSLSDAIKRVHGDKLPKDLGKLVYTMSFSYVDQESFVKCVADAKCKMMICNYPLMLYQKYLTPEKGWRTFEFLTTTSVGSKKDNVRTEVLYYNY